MKSLRLNPMSSNQDLIPNLTAISIPSEVKSFNHSIWNYMVSFSEVICPIGP